MEKTNWTNLEKIAFRFAAFYFGLNIIPFPLDQILGDYLEWYTSAWTVLINWTGKAFFHTGNIVLTETGAGDTLRSWVQHFDIVLIALIGTFIWSFLDKKRLNYDKFKLWFDIYLRFYLFVMLSIYGFAKIFPSQFGTLPDFRLYQRMGDMSPMGLLWSFMAFSEGYQMFTGLVEVLGGYCLLFRKTTMFGALIGIAAMVQVFMLNMCFDVPVKLYSLFLMLVSVYLIAPDARRLLYFFFLNKPTEPSDFSPISSKEWVKVTDLVIKGLITVVMIGGTIYGKMVGFGQDAAAETNLTSEYGAYEVTRFDRFSPPNTEGDTTRWSEVYMDKNYYSDVFSVANNMGYRERARFKMQDSTKTLRLIIRGEKPDTCYMKYVRPDSNSWVLNGKWHNDSIAVELKKQPKRSFLLKSRGFHWINETPFNK